MGMLSRKPERKTREYRYVRDDVVTPELAAARGKQLHRSLETAKINIGQSVHQLPVLVQKLQLCEKVGHLQRTYLQAHKETKQDTSRTLVFPSKKPTGRTSQT